MRLRQATQRDHSARRWSDGGEGEIDGWTLQWTKTHVRVRRNLEPGQGRPFGCSPSTSPPLMIGW
jgi:hypothetical protein